MKEASAPGNKRAPAEVKERKAGFARVRGLDLHSQDAIIDLALLNRVPMLCGLPGNPYERHFLWYLFDRCHPLLGRSAAERLPDEVCRALEPMSATALQHQRGTCSDFQEYLDLVTDRRAAFIAPGMAMSGMRKLRATSANAVMTLLHQECS